MEFTIALSSYLLYLLQVLFVLIAMKLLYVSFLNLGVGEGNQALKTLQTLILTCIQ